MLKDFIEKIVDLANSSLEEVNGKMYCQKALRPIKNRPEAINLHTLTGLVSFINNSDCSSIVVNSPDKVTLMRLCAEWDEFFPVAIATRYQSNNPFKFGEKYEIENFIIRMAAEFAPTPDRDEIIKLVSSLTSGATHTNEDDGISQTVTVKRGISLKGEKTINSRVCLRPYRTFHEVSQPESYYVFRVYQDENMAPKVALHEAEGGQWQHAAVTLIRDFFDAQESVKKANISVLA